MNIHFCLFEPDVRLWRVHVDTRWFHLGIALRHRDRYADMTSVRWISLWRK